jgi:hypothetical protein
MDLLGLTSAIWRRKFLAVAMILVATAAALWTAYKLPSMQKRSIAVGAATSQILVDSNPSTLIAGAGTDQIAALGSRAQVLAQYLSSRDAVNQIAQQTHIQKWLITARGPFSQGTGIKNYEQQPAESRAKDLVDEGKTYRLVFEAQEDVPIITVYATGPSAAAALSLAKASYDTLHNYVGTLSRQGAVVAKQQQKIAEEAARAAAAQNPNGTTPVVPTTSTTSVVVRQLGAPEGGLVGGKADLAMMILAFIAILGIQAFIAAAIIRIKQQRRLADQLEQMTDAAPLHADADAMPERFGEGEVERFGNGNGHANGNANGEAAQDAQQWGSRASFLRR